MCASSSSASNRLWSCTRFRSIWYLRRITVRQIRCSTSGTKLKVSSCATRRFTNRSASGSPSCARRVHDSIALGRDGACPQAAARCRVPDVGDANTVPGLPTPVAVLRGRLHDDFLDVMLDEPVREATQVARRRADLLVLEVEVVVDLDVSHRDRQHLLVDSQFPRSGTASVSPWESGERASSHQSGSRGRDGSRGRTPTRSFWTSVGAASQPTTRRSNPSTGASAMSASTCTGSNRWRMPVRRSRRGDRTTMRIILTELSRASAPTNTPG